MSPSQKQADEIGSACRFGDLLRAEAHRFAARSLIRNLLVLVAIGCLAGVLIALTQFASPTPQRIAIARATVHAIVQDQAQSRDQCINDANRPPGVSDNQLCGRPLSASNLRIEDYLDPKPFSRSRYSALGAAGVSLAVAALNFLLGSTFVGAEWSSRAMVALLFWEPRRLRVMGAKVAVIVAAGVVLDIIAQAGWLGAVALLQAVVGDHGGLPAGFWNQLLGTEFRGLILVTFAGVLGFGLTSMIRNTGGTLGVGLAYFAVDASVRSLHPSWQPWLVTNNAAGLVVPGGVRVYSYRDTIDSQGNIITVSTAHVLKNFDSGLLLGTLTIIVLILSVSLFIRRDVH